MGLHSLTPSILVQEKTMKTCTKCGVEKPLTEYHKAKGNKDGYENRCKQCKKAASQTPEALELRRQRSYKYTLKHHYGLTVEDYEQMIADQGNRCACCGDRWDNVVDIRLLQKYAIFPIK